MPGLRLDVDFRSHSHGVAEAVEGGTICCHNSVQGDRVAADGSERVPPLEDLHADETVEHHGNENDKPRVEEEEELGG